MQQGEGSGAGGREDHQPPGETGPLGIEEGMPRQSLNNVPIQNVVETTEVCCQEVGHRAPWGPDNQHEQHVQEGGGPVCPAVPDMCPRRQGVLLPGGNLLQHTATPEAACQGLTGVVASSPLVQHALQEHGGQRPNILNTIRSVEPRPLYRAVKESVAIARQQGSTGDMNRCQEWGAPRVPIISVAGGDQQEGCVGAWRQGDHNPNQEWSGIMLEEIKSGSRKMVVLWDQGQTHGGGEDGGVA